MNSMFRKTRVLFRRDMDQEVPSLCMLVWGNLLLISISFLKASLKTRIDPAMHVWLPGWKRTDGEKNKEDVSKKQLGFCFPYLFSESRWLAIDHGSTTLQPHCK